MVKGFVAVITASESAFRAWASRHDFPAKGRPVPDGYAKRVTRVKDTHGFYFSSYYMVPPFPDDMGALERAVKLRIMAFSPAHGGSKFPPS